ncbi:MAG: ferrous iron transport protein B [Candidatus Goldiibacteriota bacterium]
MENKKIIKIAIAGNPNTGKTSLFNVLTGTHQHVGNWPGVTVEKKEGFFDYGGYRIEVIDLPGIYGFSAYSLDERVAREFLLSGETDIIINIVDSTNLERNLYLNLEFMELGMPMIVGLNMYDELEKKGQEINVSLLEKNLGAEAVKLTARTGRGAEALKEKIVKCFENKKCINKSTFIYPENVRPEIEKITEMLRKKTEKKYSYSRKWLAIELLEGESDVIEKLSRNEWFPEIKAQMDKSAETITRESGKDASEYIIEAKYSYLKGLVLEVVKKKNPEMSLQERLDFSDKIDRIITNSYLGVPIFLIIMFLTFFLTFSLGNPLSGLIEYGFSRLSRGVEHILGAAGAAPVLISFFTDGIIGGVGAVIVFLPNILILFLLIAVLEDSGYMARAAFVMDRFMHKIGLHGKSFIPMIIGFGCNVPAIMAVRTLENKKDRFLTILIIPFMSCSARMPVYILFTSAFFKEHQAAVVFLLYLIGLAAGVLSVKIFRLSLFRQKDTPLIMEMPPYRIPQFRSLYNQTSFRGRAFLRKAGTVILAGVVVIWLLGNIPFGVDYASGSSLLGIMGKITAPVFEPAGFGFWQAGVAVISGVLAKEVIIGVFGALYGGEETLALAVSGVFSPLSAFSFMVFVLLYVPCIPALAVIKSESNAKWQWSIIAYTFAVAWAASTILYQGGRLLGFE